MVGNRFFQVNLVFMVAPGFCETIWVACRFGGLMALPVAAIGYDRSRHQIEGAGWKSIK